MRRLLLVCLCSIVTLLSAWAQDPQYSQFYANPLYLSPAFAGSALAPRVGVNYRNQWPALDATFVTYSASFDYYFPRVNSGVGIIINRDQQFAKLNSTDIGAQYAYQLQLGERVALRAGVQLSFATRSVNFLDLNFGDQFTNDGLRSLVTTDPTLLNAGENISYFDFSSGGLLYSDRAWLGVSGHHLNRPTQSFFDQNSRLPIRMTVHAGYKVPLDDETRQGLAMNVLEREKSLSFAALYKAQGKFDQFDVGTYLTYEPVVFGVWYRGLPIKRTELGLNNNDALIFLFGFKQAGLSIGYSYDLTISNLGTSTGGAHEISASLEFPAPQPKRRVPRSARKLPCPRF